MKYEIDTDQTEIVVNVIWTPIISNTHFSIYHSLLANMFSKQLNLIFDQSKDI